MGVADFDGDGNQDIATDVAVAFGDGTGRFVQPHELPVGRDIVTADFDGNGQTDIAALYGIVDEAVNVIANELDGQRTHD